jgi:hypothetical protein
VGTGPFGGIEEADAPAPNRSAIRAGMVAPIAPRLDAAAAFAFAWNARRSRSAGGTASGCSRSPRYALIEDRPNPEALAARAERGFAPCGETRIGLGPR